MMVMTTKINKSSLAAVKSPHYQTTLPYDLIHIHIAMSLRLRVSVRVRVSVEHGVLRC